MCTCRGGCLLVCDRSVSESDVRVTASDGFSQPSLAPVCSSFVSLLVDASFGEADTYSGDSELAREYRESLPVLNFCLFNWKCVCVWRHRLWVEEPWCNAKLSWSKAKAHLPGCYQELNYSIKLLPLRLSPALSSLPPSFSPFLSLSLSPLLKLCIHLISHLPPSLSLPLSLVALFSPFFPCTCWLGRNACWCCCVLVSTAGGEKKALSSVSWLFLTSIVQPDIIRIHPPSLLCI